MTDAAPTPLLDDGRVRLRLTSTGAPRSAAVGDLQLLLHPATEVEDGLAGLWLRLRGSDGDHEPLPLLGVGATGGPCRHDVAPDGSATLRREGSAAGLRWAWSLRLLPDRAGWAWDVTVANAHDEPVEVDLVHAQDLALSAPEVLAASTLYPSQYLDVSPVDAGAAGTAVAVRQNMPGPLAPWAVLVCRTRAVRWATDLSQLTGRGLPEGAPWPGLRGELPARRLQHEHAAAVLQTEPARLAPGERWSTGFVVVVLEDHPAATGPQDAAHVEGLPPTGPAPLAGSAPGEDAVEPAGVGLLRRGGALLAARDLEEAELDALAPPGRHHLERGEEGLLSWFDDEGAHLVTAAKQRAVLRPHGQVLRPLAGLLPDPGDVTSTVWMDGSFVSHLTDGHAALGRSLSLRPSPLGLGRLHGLRVLLDLGAGWRLLGSPSLWRSAPGSATWWYALDEHLVRVHAESPTAEGLARVEVTTEAGEPVPALVLLHLDWSGAPGQAGEVRTEGASLRLLAPRDATRADGVRPGLEVVVDGAAVEEVGDDGVLLADGRGRGEPVVSLRLAPAPRWSVDLTPTGAAAARAAADGPTRAALPAGAAGPGWSGVADVVSLAATTEGPAATLLSRLDAVTGWYAHDALVHYLSPRGLEQHTGGAWGTRDVCQGPVGLLRSWGEHDAWRGLLLEVVRGQHERGDWPQAFDFLPGHRADRLGTAHGDVVYWPLLALGQYLTASGDPTVLDERVAWTGDGRPGETGTVLEHVRRALDAVEASFVPGLSLPAYGHGDWNDSLQPADPALARRMVSTWTVVLQAQALHALADGLGPSDPDLAARARGLAGAGVADLRAHLLVDGVLSGYGVVEDDGHVTPMIHPRDTRTGLSLSLLPIIHAVAGDVLTPQEARAHLELVERHLTGPDGARLFDRPVAYRGGPTEIFQRAEASSFFGREIGIMYVHAHLRHAEALARVGDGPGLLRALAQAVPVGLTDLVPSAAPRQANTYSSSSDGAFADRVEASRDYDRLLAGEVALEAGWRVYSSGPGLFLEVLTQRLLGVRHAGEELELDPVLDPSLGEVLATVPTVLGPLRLRLVPGARGSGVREVAVDGAPLELRPLTNPYRDAGAAVRREALAAVVAAGGEVVVRTG